MLREVRDEVQMLAEALGECPPDASEYAGPEGTHELADIRVKLLTKLRDGLRHRKSTRQQEMLTVVNQCAKCVFDMSVTSLTELQELPTPDGSDSSELALVDDALVRLAAVEKGSTGFIPATVAELSSVYSGISKHDVERFTGRLSALEAEKQRRKTSLAATGLSFGKLAYGMYIIIPCYRC